MKILDRDHKETLILEAIVDKNCKNMVQISDETSIRYVEVRHILRSTGLINDFKAALREETIKKLLTHYKSGMSISRLSQLSRMNYDKVYYAIEEVKKRYEEGPAYVDAFAEAIHKSILEIAEIKDPVLYYAYKYWSDGRKQMDFNKIYQRVQDLFTLDTVPACAKKWGVKKTTAADFMYSMGLSKEAILSSKQPFNKF